MNSVTSSASFAAWLTKIRAICKIPQSRPLRTLPCICDGCPVAADILNYSLLPKFGNPAERPVEEFTNIGQGAIVKTMGNPAAFAVAVAAMERNAVVSVAFAIILSDSGIDAAEPQAGERSFHFVRGHGFLPCLLLTDARPKASCG